MKIKIALSKYWQTEGKIPQDRTDIWREFNGSFVNQEIPVEKFPVAVQKGYCYTACHHTYRKGANFLSSQFLALDIDNGTGSFENLLRNDFIRQWGYFLHTTPSHTAEHPRTRVIFILDKPIEDGNLYALMATSFVDYFKLSDQVCKDATRFFYGSRGCDIHMIGNILPFDVFEKSILIPYKEKVKKEAEQKTNHQSIIHVPNKILRIHREKLLDHVRIAPDGDKYNTLLRIGTTLGGYIATGYYDFYECNQLMRDAILSNPHNVKDFNHAFKCIEQALEHGSTMPLYFDTTYKELDDVQPPLSHSQKEQVQVLMWKMYHNGMRDNQKQQWYNLGFNDWVIDAYNLGYRQKSVNQETGEIIDSALTIPFVDQNGDVLNVEYKTEQDHEYENEYPVLFYAGKEENDKPMVILPDSLTALTTHLRFGNHYQFAGLPHMDIVKDTVEQDGAVVLLEPDTTDRNFKSIRNHCRFYRLPMGIGEMIKYGLNSEALHWYVNAAERK